MSMGLVHIHGKARAPKSLLSPITRTPCFFYKVNIEKWKRDEHGGGSWSHYRTDTNGLSFYVEDGSGKTLINAEGAELDLVQSSRREVRSDSQNSSFSQASAPVAGIEATDEDLLSYVSQVTTKKVFSFVSQGLSTLAAHTGAGSNPQVQTALDFLRHPVDPEVIQKMLAARQLSDPNQEQIRLSVLEALKHPVGSPEFDQQLRQAAAIAQVDPQQMAKFREHIQSWQRFRESGVVLNAPPASGRYRLTEFCILPEQEYDVTGTCMENPTPADEHDRNLVTKGVNEPTFLISYRTERQLESRLRNRALLMVFGGGAGAVVCLALLLAKLGLL
jgi:hypothetical protein